MYIRSSHSEFKNHDLSCSLFLSLPFSLMPRFLPLFLSLSYVHFIYVLYTLILLMIYRNGVWRA